MRYLQRTRRRPGPLVLITLAWLWAGSTVARAHDPGLSALDVRVADNLVSISLSIAAPDVATLAQSESGVQRALGEMAADAVRLSVEGTAVSPVIDDVSIEDGAARLGWSFAIPPSRDRTRRLTITSDVPARMARGHRQLLVVMLGDRVLTQQLLDAESGAATIDLEAASRSTLRAAWQFLELGVRHILTGYDHLVFLAGLLLAVRTVRELVGALTAFTAAHSVSLALVVIGGVQAPASIVEPLIAASIAWVGLENLRYGQHRARWLAVFGFGLIHGFGLAGALMELGFGSSTAEIVLALISFNGGVEAGQLGAAAAMLPLIWMIRSRPLWQARLLPLCSVMIVAAGGYWLIERLM